MQKGEIKIANQMTKRLLLLNDLESTQWSSFVQSVFMNASSFNFNIKKFFDRYIYGSETNDFNFAIKK